MKANADLTADPRTGVQSRSGLVVGDGTLESLKWLALGLMLLDHVNKYLLADRVDWMFNLGRVAMPLFGFALVYNLARPGSLAAGAHTRIMKRLAIAGLVATAPFIALGGLAMGWWPLNILFMLLVATATISLLERRGVASEAAATAVFIVGGAFVEFWWFGLAFCITAWWYCKKPSAVALCGWLAASASLYVVNGNLWAVAAMPIILAAQFVRLKTPRASHLFYVLYPAHLLTLVFARLTLPI